MEEGDNNDSMELTGASSVVVPSTKRVRLECLNMPISFSDIGEVGNMIKLEQPAGEKDKQKKQPAATQKKQR